MKSNHNQILRSSLMIACAATAVSGAFAQEGGASTGQAAEKTVAERRVIDEIFVRGRRLGDLRGDTASAVTLSDIPLEDLPLNVSVIPRGLIDLVNPRDTRRVIEQNASVVTRTGHVQSFQGIFIRGFSNDGEINGRLKNGVPFYGVDSPIADNSVLERVEVLKGSAGLLFGAASPGGVLNYVYKTPQEEPAYGVDVTVGDFSTLRADLDATGAVISDTLNYRFTLGYEDSDGWQDYDYYEKLAPTLQLQARLGARTTVSLLAELINVDSNPSNQDTVFTGGRTGTPIELPIETYLGHANDYSEERTEQFQFVANHDFDNGFGLVAQFGSNTTEREQGNTGYMGFFGAPSPSGDVTRVQFDQKRTSDGKYGAVHLTWAGETGDFTHKALIGVNASENQMFNINGFSSRAAPFAGPFVEGGVLPPTTQINIYNPVTTDYPHLTNFADSPPFSHLQWTYEDRGLNLQDLIGYDAWNLKVLLGLRYSESDLSFQKQTSHSGAPSPNPRESSSANKWIPRVGVIWSANDTVDFFASYGESFNPQFNVQQGENGAPLTDPETGQQVEAGMRLYPFNGDLSVSLTAYELTKQNVVRSNPDVPNTSLLDGEQRSRGVELDIAGSLSDAIDLYLSYAYTDTEIVQGANDADTGAQFTGIPKNKLVAWADWEFWNGYSVAYGLDYQDDHNTDLAGAAVIDGRTLHELRLRKTYVLEGVDLNVELAARNLTDEVWYQNATNPVFIKRGEPRSFFATLRADF